MLGILVILFGVLGGQISQAHKIPESGKRAVAHIKGDKVEGTVWFSQAKDGAPTTVKGEIKGLSSGKHGFHVHQTGNVGDHCESAGPHFNPLEKTHGAPTAPMHHLGDLGNLEVGHDGVAHFEITDHQLPLSGPHSILNRAIVVHKDIDDLGHGEGNKKAESLKTGNSGARVGCGVISPA